MSRSDSDMLVSCRLLRSRPPFWRDLLESAQKYGIGGTQKVEGDASLRVAFENAPPGAKTYTRYTAACFKKAKVDCGHPMSPSDPGGD
jgi:hypothetical protein